MKTIKIEACKMPFEDACPCYNSEGQVNFCNLAVDEVIEDSKEIPQWCPIREESIEITIEE